MYDARRATNWVSVIYFVTLIVMGMMIVMNLFLAILLSNFTNKDDDDAEAKRGDGGIGATSGDNLGSPKAAPYSPASPPITAVGSSVPLSDATRLGAGFTSPRDYRPPRSDGEFIARGGSRRAAGAKIAPELTDDAAADGRSMGVKQGQNDQPRGVRRVLLTVRRLVMRSAAFCKGLGVMAVNYGWDSVSSLRVPEDLDPGRALLLLGPGNPIRRGCIAIVVNPGFDRLILLLISVSSVTLAMDNPLRNPDSAITRALERVDVVMTILFFVEMMLKICAKGFVAMPGAYLRSSWNVLDFVVVAVSVFQLFGSDSASLKSLRSLRALRALRPLR